MKQFVGGVLLLGSACALAPLAIAQTPAPSEPAAPAPAPTPLWLGDSGVNVEQARARRREQNVALLRWEQATTVGEYERVGQKDPRWDADARETLEQYAHSLAEGATPARNNAILQACQRVLSAGCKDPLLAYVALRFKCYPAGTTREALAQLYTDADQGMEKSAYSPLRKFYAALRSSEQAAKPAGSRMEPNDEADAALARARAHLVELLADPAAARDSVYAAAHALFLACKHDAAGLKAVFDPLATVFESGQLKEVGESATAKLVEGLFWTSYAWQGRSARWARDVTDEGWRMFSERLPKAQTALEKSYKLDPASPHLCHTMMNVELGQGEGGARMETWFRRTLDADPDSYQACTAKLLYLEPKWYGDPQAMLDFGHECQRTANWGARLPFILLLAHTRLASDTPKPLDYWKLPAVWRDVQQLYQAALAANPGSVYDRSGYALYAYRAEQWKLADELFKAVGDKPDLSAMQCTPAVYSRMRQTAADKAAAVP